MREHRYRDTMQPDVVLVKELDSFQPVTEIGLGTFNYKLVDINSINAKDDEYSFTTLISKGFKKSIELIQSNILDSLLFIAIVLIIYLIVSWFYISSSNEDNNNKNIVIKEKQDIDYVDLEKNALNTYPYSPELLNSQYETPNQFTASATSLTWTSNSSPSTAFASPFGISNASFKTPQTPTAAEFDTITNLPDPIDSKVLMNRLRIN